jgi:amidase
MNRRNFLKNSAVAGIGAGVISASACNIGPGNKKTPGMYTDDFELSEVTIAQLQEKMKAGTHTARSITELYLQRIDAIDRKGPKINSVLEINPEALSIAEGLDKERKNGKVRGPMHGIPVLLKDNINTGDKMMTTAGSLALEGHVARWDAFIVSRLREAGAVILGKVNLSEWANFRSTRSSSGWSSRGGQTKNPCVLDRNPCGSSSGSAAAVAANLCAVAVGTETDGSVIAPSSFCGIVGIKPTIGLVSRSGIIPISATQDTAGPMARTVTDAAILLGAMAGADEDDAVTAGHVQRKDYTKALDAGALKGKRIGVEKDFYTGHEQVVALYKAAIDTMKKLGAEIIEIELVKETRKLGDAEFEVLLHEFKDGLNKYLGTADARVKSLADVIRFNKEHENETMPWFRQELLEMSEAKGPLTDAAYTDALARSKSAAVLIDDLMKQHRLDAICGISIGPANATDLVNGDYPTGPYFCPPAAMAGYPHITVPMGKVWELPVGLSIMAEAFAEEKIIGLAYAYEKASGKRSAPEFLPTINP